MKIEYPDKYFTEEEMENTQGRHKKFLEEWEENNDFNFTVFKNPDYNQMIVLKDIDFFSLCSHHLLPFTGKVHIGYIPDKRICGISKLARVVDKFASRPQIQERMTQEIADYLEHKLNPLGVMVVVEGQHLCMKMRGVKKLNSVMITSAIKGVFEKQDVRDEFLKLIGGRDV